jgi:hypothetical protein
MSRRFVSPCTPPEGRVRELLIILMEEAAEVQQRAAKALRFGLDEIQPGQELTNANRIEDEVGDFIAIYQKLAARDVLDVVRVGWAVHAKHQKVNNWFQTEGGE